MQTLKTIVATAVITLAATTVAFAGVGRVERPEPDRGRRRCRRSPPISRSRPGTRFISPVRRSSSWPRRSDATSRRSASRSGTPSRHQSDAKHAHAAQHAYASAGHDAAARRHPDHATQPSEQTQATGAAIRRATRPASRRATRPATGRPHAGERARGGCGGGRGCSRRTAERGGPLTTAGRLAPYTVLRWIRREVEE